LIGEKRGRRWVKGEEKRATRRRRTEEKEERRGFVAEKARLIKLADRVRLLLHLFAETQRI